MVNSAQKKFRNQIRGTREHSSLARTVFVCKGPVKFASKRSYLKGFLGFLQIKENRQTTETKTPGTDSLGSSEAWDINVSDLQGLDLVLTQVSLADGGQMTPRSVRLIESGRGPADNQMQPIPSPPRLGTPKPRDMRPVRLKERDRGPTPKPRDMRPVRLKERDRGLCCKPKGPMGLAGPTVRVQEGERGGSGLFGARSRGAEFWAVGQELFKRPDYCSNYQAEAVAQPEGAFCSADNIISSDLVHAGGQHKERVSVQNSSLSASSVHPTGGIHGMPPEEKHSQSLKAVAGRRGMELAAPPVGRRGRRGTVRAGQQRDSILQVTIASKGIDANVNVGGKTCRAYLYIDGHNLVWVKKSTNFISSRCCSSFGQEEVCSLSLRQVVGIHMDVSVSKEGEERRKQMKNSHSPLQQRLPKKEYHSDHHVMIKKKKKYDVEIKVLDFDDEHGEECKIVRLKFKECPLSSLLISQLLESC